MANALYAKMRTEIPDLFLTPLDKKVQDIWAAEIQEYMEGTETASEALEKIQKKVNQDFASEKRYILNYLGQ